MKYYLHDTNAFSDEKVTKLFMKYGYEGLGLFFTILEKLAFHEKPMETKVLKKQLFVDARLRPLWKYMVELGLLEENNGETFNNNVLNVSEKYYIKKEKTRKKVAEWRASKGEENDVTGYTVVTEGLRNLPKENKTKEKENADFVVVRKEEKSSDDGGEVCSSEEEAVHLHLVDLKNLTLSDDAFTAQYQHMGFDRTTLGMWLTAFNRWLMFSCKIEKDESDYRRHFRAWLKRVPYKTIKPEDYSPVSEDKIVETVVPKNKSVEDQLRERYGEDWDG